MFWMPISRKVTAGITMRMSFSGSRSPSPADFQVFTAMMIRINPSSVRMAPRRIIRFSTMRSFQLTSSRNVARWLYAYTLAILYMLIACSPMMIMHAEYSMVWILKVKPSEESTINISHKCLNTPRTVRNFFLLTRSLLQDSLSDQTDSLLHTYQPDSGRDNHLPELASSLY